MAWRIWLEALPPTQGWPAVVPAGWYGGRLTSINQAIYMRTDDVSDAVVFSTQRDVIEQVRDWRSRGYPCHAVPSIVVQEVI